MTRRNSDFLPNEEKRLRDKIFVSEEWVATLRQKLDAGEIQPVDKARALNSIEYHQRIVNNCRVMLESITAPAGSRKEKGA